MKQEKNKLLLDMILKLSYPKAKKYNEVNTTDKSVVNKVAQRSASERLNVLQYYCIYQPVPSPFNFTW